MITAMPYDPSVADRWDALVDQSSYGTLLHSRRFLDYHGDRFADASLALLDDKERWLGVFPAALHPADPTVAVSHPGCTYGGLVPGASHGLPGTLDEMLTAVGDALRARGVTSVRYKDVPLHVVDAPNQAIGQALWRAGGTLVRRDLWNVIEVADRKLSSSHRRNLSKAHRAGLTFVARDDDEAYAAFHGVLKANLRERYGTDPVHSLAELWALRQRLGAGVQLHDVRTPEGALLAAVWVFRYGARCWHTQYITSTPGGRDVGATVFLLEELCAAAEAEGVRYVSFGASTEDGGRYVNEGLFRHKAGFGKGAVVADHLHWPLDR